MHSAQETKRIALIRKDEIAEANKVEELKTIENEIRDASLLGDMQATLYYSICKENCEILKGLGYNVLVERIRNNSGYCNFIQDCTTISWEKA